MTPAPRFRFAILFFTVLIDLIGFGILIPILPYYAQRLGAGGLGIGVLFGIYSGMQFFSTAVLGRLSDRVGRRPILLTTIVMNVAGCLLFAAAHSYAVLFVARVFSGFGGGNISAAQAYVADITTPAERSRGMGIIGAAFGIGFVLGPAIGGFAAHLYGPTAPALVAAGLSVLNFVSAYFVLPESLHADLRATRPLLDLSHLPRALRHEKLAPLMWAWFLAAFAFAGYTVALPLWTGAQFGWRERELGWFFTLIGATAAIVQGGLFGRIAKHTGDRRLVIAGSFGMALAIAVVPALPSAPVLYAFTIVLAFSNSIFVPAATGLVSILADPTEQGTVLGAAQALSALGRLCGPIILGHLYDVASPAAAFVAAGLIMVVAATATIKLPEDHPRPV
jgi:MFS family permease